VSASTKPLLQLLNVESSYGPIKAIRGVSLDVHAGEIVTVLGSNGAGKTTILKTISGPGWMKKVSTTQPWNLSDWAIFVSTSM
jgi:ABC-type branched-subunit amino acid transport system ATPase component